MHQLLTAIFLFVSMSIFGQEVQVMTFNIRYDNPNDPITWEERRDEVAQAMFFHDLIGVQEALKHQVEYIDERLPLHDWVGVGRDDGESSGEFAAIFYNTATFTLIHAETIWLSPWMHSVGSVGWDAQLPRTATIALFKHNASGKTLRVINTHFSHVGDDARIYAAHLLRGFVGLATQDRVVILGDFNADPDSEPYAVLSAPPLADAYEAASLRCRQDFTTYGSFDPHASIMLRIDHIFSNADRVNWICAEEYIKYGFYISDHLPVFMTFNM